MQLTRRSLLALGAVVAGLGLLGYALLAGTTDEEKIRERLGDLTQALSFTSPDENIALRSLRLRKTFSSLFEPTAVAHIPELGSQHEGSDGLALLAARSMGYFNALDVSLGGIEIRVDPSRQNARVSSTASLIGSRGASGPERDQRRVDFEFKRSDQHGWRIARVEVLAGDDG